MIKRRFYRYEHGNDKDAASDSSSSSSGSEVEAQASEADDTDIEEEEVEVEEEENEDQEEEEEEENVASDVREKGEASSSSGYESEDSSVNEVNLDSSGFPTSDEDAAAQTGSKNIIGSFSGRKGNNLPTIAPDSPKKAGPDFETADCILRHKSVFKCRLCPRIVCLSEETLKAHLISKKHIRSEKLLREGRLKLMLNERGEVEGELHYENDATTTASQQKSDKPSKKGKGGSKQKKRPRQDNESRKAKPSTEKRDKRQERRREKRRKNDD